MKKYLLIESKDPFEFHGAREDYAMAAELAKAGNQVTFFLVQNGVLPTRKGPQSALLQELSSAGVEVLADDFSLRERGIQAGSLVSGVKAAPLTVVVDQLAEGRKAMWL